MDGGVVQNGGGGVEDGQPPAPAGGITPLGFIGPTMGSAGCAHAIWSAKQATTAKMVVFMALLRYLQQCISM